MNKTAMLCALALSLALAACGQRSAAERTVREALNDPDSARFGAFYHNSNTGRACVTVNAKNSMGGYVGNRQAHLVMEKGAWHWEGEPMEETPADCRDGYAAQPSAEALAAAEKRAHAGETPEQTADRLDREAEQLERQAGGAPSLPNLTDDAK